MKIVSNLTFIVFLLGLVTTVGTSYWIYQNPTLNLGTTQPVKQKIHNGDTSDAKYGQSVELQSGEQIKKDAKIKSLPLYLKGYVNMPSVGVYQPIFEGTNQRTLALGAGTIKPNQGMNKVGNYAIAAHNRADWYWGNSFGELQPKDVVGLPVYSTDGKNIYKYQVVDKKVVPAEQSMKFTEDDYSEKELAPQTKQLGIDTKEASSIKDVTSENNNDTKNMKNEHTELSKNSDALEPANNDTDDNQKYTYGKMITLYTCYEIPPDYYHAANRIIVRGVMTQKTKVKNATKEQQALFPELFDLNQAPKNDTKGIEGKLATALRYDPDFLTKVAVGGAIVAVISLVISIIASKVASREEVFVATNAVKFDDDNDNDDDFEDGLF